MAEVRQGTLTMVLEDSLAPSEQAGTLSKVEVARIHKTPRGLRPLCEDTADALEKAGAQFLAPLGVTPKSLREAGARVEKLDQVILDGEVLLARLKQQSLLNKAEAYAQVRKVNDFVKAQGKHNQEIKTLFQRVLNFFARLRKGKKSSAAKPPLSPAQSAAPGSK